MRVLTNVKNINMIEESENKMEEKNMERIEIIPINKLKEHISTVLAEEIVNAKEKVKGLFNEKIEEIIKSNYTTVETIELEIPLVSLAVKNTVSDGLIKDFKEAGYESLLKPLEVSEDQKKDDEIQTIIIRLM